MKQIFKATAILVIAPLVFFVFSPFVSATLSGKTTVNYSNSITVSQNTIFSLAVEGYTDTGRVIQEVGFSSPRSYTGYSSANNWYTKNCGSSSTSCSLAWSISESSPGTYTYTGRVTDIDSDTGEADYAYTNNIIVTVVAAQAPGGTPPAGNFPPAGNVTQQSCPAGTICLENPLSVSTFDALLNKIIDFIFWVGITVAPVIFIIAGFLFVTSAGDAKKLETAKHMMLYTVIGLVVLLLARGLVSVLKSVIGVQ